MTESKDPLTVAIEALNAAHDYVSDICGSRRELLEQIEAAQEALTAPRAAADTEREALRAFIGAAYPVDTLINPRGYNWCEAYLDEALPKARAALSQPAKAQSKEPRC